MNPDTCIKPWLLAVGKPHGILRAEDHRKPDADDYEKQPYFEYRIIRYEPNQLGIQDQSTNTESTAHRSAWQNWIAVVQVDLKDCPDGLYVLAQACIAIRHNPSLRKLFKDQSCAYIDTQEPDITNESTWDDERIKDHHRLVCTFNENIAYSLDETNAVVEQVRITFTMDGEEVYAGASISNIQADTATLTLSGQDADLTES